MDITLRSFPHVEGWFHHRQSPLAGQRQEGAASFASTLRGMAAAEMARPSDAPGYNDDSATKTFSQMPLVAPVSVDFERGAIGHERDQVVRDFPSNKEDSRPISDAGLMSRNAPAPVGQTAPVLNVVPSAFQRVHGNPARVQSMTPGSELENLALLQSADRQTAPKASEDAKLNLTKHLSWLPAAQDRLYLRCVGHENQVNITVRLNGLTDREQQHLRNDIEQMARLKGLTIDHLRITALGKE